MAQEKTIRIFVSSPSDVWDERRRAALVIDRLNRDLEGRIRLEPVLWEENFYRASSDFQSQIPPVEVVDIVICILWKRLGSDLPPDFNRGDGSARTGTEFEFETAMQAALEGELPDIFLFRKTAKITFDAETVDLEKAQFKALEAFWEKWIRNEDGHFTAAFQHFDDTDGFEAQLEKLLRRWLDERQRDVDWPIATKGSPFRGLEPFDEDHAAVFFGRRRAIKEVLARLSATARRGCAFLLLLGMSGAGKSSLVRAGVIPRLMAAGAVPEVDRWRRCVMRPQADGGGPDIADPLRGLAQALYAEDVLPELADGDTSTPEDLYALMARDPEGVAAPIKGALTRWGKAVAVTEGYERPVETRLLLVIDQFEELFGLDPATAQRFASLLAAVARSGRVWVIATMRSDFYGALQSLPSLVALKEDGASYDVLAPGAAEIREIIEAPARAAGLTYAEDAASGKNLATLLEEAASSPESLPLLGFMLQELFDHLDPARNLLQATVYRDLGGLEGAIEARAEATFKGLSPVAQEAFPALIRRLVTASEDGVATARTAPLDRAGLSPEMAALVDAFIAARLLVAGGSAGGTSLRVAHEALLSHWDRAAAAIRQNMSDLRLRARLEQAAALWRDQGRDAARLWRGDLELSEAADLLARLRGELSQEVADFADASLAAARARREKTLRRTRMVAAALALLALLSGAGAYFGISGQQAAEAQRQIAEGQRAEAIKQKDAAEAQRRLAAENAAEAERRAAEVLVAQSRFLLAGAERALAVGNAELATLLLLEAAPEDLAAPERPLEPAVLATLGKATAADRGILRLLNHHDTVTDVAYAPDGRIIASASGAADGDIGLWDAQTGMLITALKADGSGVTRIAFSPDGTRLASATEDGLAYLWDVAAGSLLYRLEGHAEQVADLAFSPDGVYLATASDDGSAILWDAETGTARFTFDDHPDQVLRVDFANGGQELVTLSEEVHFWSVDTGREVRRIPAEFDGFSDMAMGPDGKTMVLAADSGSVGIWAVETAREFSHLEPHMAGISRVAYSPDGVVIATGSEDGVVRVYAVRMGAIVVNFQHNGVPVTDLAFAPDGSGLAVAYEDGSVTLWDKDKETIAAHIAAHGEPINRIAYAPDGQRLATASDDLSLRVWSTAPATEVVERGIPGAGIPRFSIAADGSRVAAFKGNAGVIVWDTATGADIYPKEPPAPGPSIVDRDLPLPDQPARGGGFMSLFGRGADAPSDAPPDGFPFQDDGFPGAPGGPFPGSSFPDPIQNLALSADGKKLVTASFAGPILVRNVETGEVQAKIQAPNLIDPSLILSPDGTQLLIVAQGSDATLWSTDTGDALASLGHPGEEPGTTATFSDDGRYLALYGRSGALQIYGAEKGAFITRLAGHDLYITDVAFSKAGDKVASVSFDGSASVWETNSWKPLGRFSAGQSGLQAVAFSPDGEYLAATAQGDGSVPIWTVADQKLVTVLRGHGGQVNHLAFSPDGGLLATASEDKTVRLWEVKSGAQVAVYEGAEAGVMAVAFSADGKRLISTAGDWFVRIWPLQELQPQTLDQVRAGRFRDLTAAERATHFLPPVAEARFRFSILPGGEGTTECDRLAGDPSGYFHLYKMLSMPQVDPGGAAAVAACEAALAASPDEPRLVFRMARAQVLNGKLEEARVLYERVQSMGYAPAAFDLAAMTQIGVPGPANIEAALALYQEALAGQVAAAGASLGWIYWNGDGVPQDRQKALGFFQQAAAKGDAPSHFQLASLKALGEEGAQDIAGAIYHFEIARRLFAKLGNLGAVDFAQSRRANLARMLDDPEKLSDAYRRAQTWMPTSTAPASAR
ncbi:MAG: AAA family ATPase [Magnetospiraceae bacterium]